MSLIDKAQQLIRQQHPQPIYAIDATTGNGNDTLFLAQLVNPNGHVFGFDIQRQAIINTEQKLLEFGLSEKVSLWQNSHHDMSACIPEKFHGKIDVAMFNLGYLPGADKSMITQSEITIKALDCTASLLVNNGILTVIAYPGHAGGEIELQNVQLWVNQLQPSTFLYELILSDHPSSISPQLFVIQKRMLIG